MKNPNSKLHKNIYPAIVHTVWKKCYDCKKPKRSKKRQHYGWCINCQAIRTSQKQ